MKFAAKVLALVLARAFWGEMWAFATLPKSVGPMQWADSMAYVGTIDGRTVLAVGGHHDSSKSHLLFLNPDGTEETALRQELPTGGGFLGSSIAAGDVTGSGQMYVILGAYGVHDGPCRRDCTTCKCNTGAIQFYSIDLSGGELPTASTIILGKDYGAINVASWSYDLTVFDVDEDGVDDVLVTAQGQCEGNAGWPCFDQPNEGYITILFMTKTSDDPAVHDSMKITCGQVPSCVDENDQFGTSIAPLGDLDEDGVIEYAVGGKNKVWILSIDSSGAFYGSENLISQSDVGLGTVTTYFGVDVAAAGDVDGDSVPDLLVGASGYSGNTGMGMLLLLNADKSIKDTYPIYVDPNWGAAIRCGSSILALGDMDGNFFPEVALGCSSGWGPSHVVILNDVYIFGDTDGDGFSDFVENLSCSDPTNFDSIPLHGPGICSQPTSSSGTSRSRSSGSSSLSDKDDRRRALRAKEGKSEE
uniref:Uncharacterized protein n=1 Tax=Pseudictyota dubia TaxID=2749911 RepID=A0A7R9W5V4_9STRA|mmetsp:Transcript_33065/g.60948  ORF Transcript_33065/g.60948 Transcript_33065/m.60948 type:complete len:473 (+) Transcript_33065:612-2030(+)